MNKKVFIGVAWPYVNGDLHIGHLAGYLLPADIFARYNRCVGNDVLMVSGSDCFGTPITVEADKEGKKPAEIVEEYHKKDVYLFKDVLGLTYDLYTKTLTDYHIKITQDFFVKLFEEGYIFTDRSLQYYSEDNKKFLPDRYVVGKCPHCGFGDARSDQCDFCGRVLNQGELINPVSNLTRKPAILKETEHYFLDWPKLQPQLQKYVDHASKSWKEWVRAETLGLLSEGLKPRAITRDIDWGVLIPKDRLPKDKVINNIDNKRIYVWFDAVIGYYSASLLWAKETGGDWKKFWYDADTEHYYFMGKDNLIFHTLFWPGQLMAYNSRLHLPDIVSINMFFDLEGQKFSKSRGIIIDTKDIVEKYGNDRVRFYLTLVMPETQDSSFSWTDFREKVNGILVDNIGNFIHRTLSIGYDSGVKPDTGDTPEEIIERVEQAFLGCARRLERCEFRSYLDQLIQLAKFGNKVCDSKEIWLLKKQNPDEFKKALAGLYLINIALAHLLTPIMPDAAARLKRMLDIDLASLWPKNVKGNAKFLSLISKVKLGEKPTPLFEKINSTS